MKLNLNSINARLYRWYYCTNIMPANLCPYFWKLVILYITIIPYTIISLPILCVDKDNSTGFTKKVIGGLFIYISLFLTLSGLFSISLFWKKFSPESFLGLVQWIGVATWMFALIIAAVEIIRYYSNKPHNYKEKHKKTSIIGEFIKAKYHKYCPSITWEHKENINKDV